MRQQDFRRIVNPPQSGVEHLEDPDFERRSEPVLDTPQDAVDVVAVALELQHHVDDVFEYLGTGYRAVLGDVADDEDRRSGRFGVFQKRRRAFADLRHASRRRVQEVGVNRLYRVDHHQVGTVLGDLRHDVFQQRFGIDQALVVADADARGAHLDLLGRLLARDVEGFQSVRRQRDLQREGRFADSRLAAHEDQRPRDHPAAQHAVYLGVSQIEADVLAFADVPHALRLRRGQGTRRDRRDRTALAGDDLLGERVPFAARGAASQPFRGFEPAVFAEKCLFDLCHTSSYFAFAEVYSRRTAFVIPASG